MHIEKYFESIVYEILERTEIRTLPYAFLGANEHVNQTLEVNLKVE